MKSHLSIPSSHVSTVIEIAHLKESFHQKDKGVTVGDHEYILHSTSPATFSIDRSGTVPLSVLEDAVRAQKRLRELNMCSEVSMKFGDNILSVEVTSNENLYLTYHNEDSVTSWRA